MFCPDILALKRFYATSLGAYVERALQRRIRQWWKNAAGESMLGLGYTTGYLEAFEGEAAQIAVAMPALQGAAYWPQGKANRVVLCDESMLPLADNIFNRVLIIHAAEYTQNIQAMMDEVARVLTPGGRAIAVVPNRLSIWARLGRSPFGHGHPFTLAQWRQVLAESELTVTRVTSALFMPPVFWEVPLKLAPYVEVIGRAIYLLIGGVLIVEAEKQIYAGVREPAVVRRRAQVTAPAMQPVMGKVAKLPTR